MDYKIFHRKQVFANKYEPIFFNPNVKYNISYNKRLVITLMYYNVFYKAFL